MSRMTLSGDGDGDGDDDGDGVNLEEEADERRNSCKLVYCRPLKKRLVLLSKSKHWLMIEVNAIMIIYDNEQLQS